MLYPEIKTWAMYRKGVSDHVKLHTAFQEMEERKARSELDPDRLIDEALQEGMNHKMAAIRDCLHEWEKAHPPLDPKREVDENFEAERTSLDRLTSEFCTQVLRNRDQILRGFIAEYGLAPGQVEQVVQITPEGWRWFVRALPLDEQQPIEVPPLPDGAE